MFTPIGFFAGTSVLPPYSDTATLFYSADRNTDWTDLSPNGNDGTIGTLGSGGSAAIDHVAGATPYWQFKAPNPLTEQKFLDTNYAKTVSGDYSVILVISLSDVTTNNIQGVGGLATPSGNASFNIGQNTTQRFYHGNKGANVADNLFLYGNTILSTDTFYMVTVVGDSSGIYLYNNNILDGSDTSNGTAYASSETFVLGRDISLTANYVNNQKVAAYAFFDGVALNATQRTELYDYYNEIYNLPQLLLLDKYQNAYAAWSLRKLRNDYTGAAIQVTRTSDSATQEIGFVGEDLDTSALTTFAGGNTCVVSIWYDQSGNGRDIDIPSAKRPTIVSSGTLQTLSSGKPTLKPTSGVLGVDTGISGLTDKSVFFAGDTTNVLGGTAASRVLSSYAGTGGVGNDYIISHYNSSPDFIRLFDQGTTATQTLDRGEIVIGSYADSGEIGFRANDLTIDISTGTSAANPNNYHLFEDRGGALNNEIPAFASEYVLYDTSKDADLDDIMTNINTYYIIY